MIAFTCYLQILLENKGKFLLVHASSGFKHSLKGNLSHEPYSGVVKYLLIASFFVEVLQDPAVQVKLSDTKAASEVKALEQFYQILQNEPAKAFYGKNHVIRAAEAQAVETLLISDNLFR